MERKQHERKFEPRCTVQASNTIRGCNSSAGEKQQQKQTERREGDRQTDKRIERKAKMKYVASMIG